jgi:hypothetical protein
MFKNIPFWLVFVGFPFIVIPLPHPYSDHPLFLCLYSLTPKDISIYVLTIDYFNLQFSFFITTWMFSRTFVSSLPPHIVGGIILAPFDQPHWHHLEDLLFLPYWFPPIEFQFMPCPFTHLDHPLRHS